MVIILCSDLMCTCAD